MIDSRNKQQEEYIEEESNDERDIFAPIIAGFERKEEVRKIQNLKSLPKSFKEALLNDLNYRFEAEKVDVSSIYESVDIPPE